MPKMDCTSGHVRLLRLLPSQDQDDFLRFIYPLRARAAVFFAVLQIAFYAIDMLVIGTTHHALLDDPLYIGRRVVAIVLQLVLIAVVALGSIRAVSVAVHLWFLFSAIVRVAILSSFAFSRPQLSASYLMYMLCTVILGLAGIATTMHISFILVTLATLPFMVLFVIAVQRADGFANDFPKGSATVYVFVTFVTLLYIVHTVQYNTVMMFIWNQRYKVERVQKDAQNRMELLHRMHLANTLHDIGSPLQAFIIGLDELRTWIVKLPSNLMQPIVYDALSGMEASVALMSLARRRAIAYAKSFTQADTMQPQYSRVDIARLASESLKVVQALSRNRDTDVEIKITLGADIPQLIWTDGDWIIEVLTNYLSNSVKFTDHGYIELRVFPTSRQKSQASSRSPTPRNVLAQKTISPSQRSQGGVYDAYQSSILRFEVLDTGHGIPPDAMDWLFLPFSQAKADRRAGTGLGLSSVKMKIEQLDGSVGAYQNYPRGAVFWFEIPMIVERQTSDKTAPTPEAKMRDTTLLSSVNELTTDDIELGIDTTAAVEREQPRHSPPSGPVPVEELLLVYNIDPAKLSLLLVEDERMVRRFSKKMLERVGFRVDEASDGVEGLQRMQQRAYDVVLMDQNMPEMGGLEAVRSFREWKAGDVEDNSNSDNDPLIFMVSASILENDRIEAADLHIAEYLEKPLHVNRIAAQVLAQIATCPRLLKKCQRPRGPESLQLSQRHSNQTETDEAGTCTELEE